MKVIRLGLVLCFAAAAFVVVAPSLLRASQEPATKTPMAAPPEANSKTDSNFEAAAVQMHALQEGLKLFREEKYRAAAGSLETAAASKASPLQTAHAYAWLARTYLHLHQVADAEEAIKKANDADKSLGNVQTAQAEVYIREGKLVDAEVLLISLVKAQNTTGRTYLGLARIHRATANYKSARALIEVAHKSDPKDPDIDRAWMISRTPKERIEELKRRLAEGRFDDEQEREGLAASIAVSEDHDKNANRTCKLTNKVTATEARLEPHMLDPRRFSSYQLGVKVNGVKALLELDTGAGGILVSSRIAEKAGLRKIADNLIGGIGDKGAANGYVAFADKLQIGELEFENCYIDVVDRKRALDIDGLIGADVFSNYLVDVDFPNQKLKLSPLPPYPDETKQETSLESDEETETNLHDRWIPPDYKDYEKVYRFGHMLLLPVALNKAPIKLFLLDTGAWDNNVSPEAAREATKLHKDNDIQIKGLSGQVKTVYSTGEIMLRFGRFQQRRTDMVAFDMSGMSNGVGTEISGALGFAMLYMLDIKLDYRDNLVNFTYDEKRFH